MAQTVVYDACVLYPAPLRDLLIRIAATGLVAARWSDKILDECFRSILSSRPELEPQRLARTRSLMLQAVPECLVTDFESIIPQLQLPDPDDRHVLAAAIQAGAQAIITFNLSDFPSAALEPHGVSAVHPDFFLLELLEHSPAEIAFVVRRQAFALRRPPTSVAQLLGRLSIQGLRRSVERLEQILL